MRSGVVFRLRVSMRAVLFTQVTVCTSLDAHSIYRSRASMWLRRNVLFAGYITSLDARRYIYMLRVEPRCTLCCLKATSLDISSAVLQVVSLGVRGDACRLQASIGVVMFIGYKPRCAIIVRQSAANTSHTHICIDIARDHGSFPEQVSASRRWL